MDWPLPTTLLAQNSSIPLQTHLVTTSCFTVYCMLLRIHAVCVCDDAALFHEAIDAILTKLGLSEGSKGRPAVRSRDIVDIIEGYKGQGYGLSTDEELGIIVKQSPIIHSSDFFFLSHISSVGRNFLSNWHRS